MLQSARSVEHILRDIVDLMSGLMQVDGCSIFLYEEGALVLKVLKGVAEYADLSLGDLLEGIVLHAFEGKPPFSPETRKVIEQLKAVYGCELTAADSHQLVESDS